MASKNTGSKFSICLLLYIIFLGIYSIFALQLHFPNTSDETINLAGAALMSGSDWSEAVLAMDSYQYRYGLTILYTPVMLIFSDPYAVYTAMIELNMMLMALIPVFSYILVTEYLGCDDRKLSITMASLLGALPSGVLFGQYSRGDFVLITLPIGILLLILRSVRIMNSSDAEKHKAESVVLGICLPLLATFGLAAHTRGLVFIIALWMTLGLIRLITGKKTIRLIPALVSQIIFLLIDNKLQALYKIKIYGTQGFSHASVESYEFENLLKIFTKDGIRSLLKLMLGWIFSACTSSFGLILIGIIGAFVVFVRYIRKHLTERNDEDTNLFITATFGFLNFAGAFAMGCLYFFSASHNFFLGEVDTRADRLVYGRYMEPGIGLLILLALFLLFSEKKYIGRTIKVVSVILFSVILTSFMIIVEPYMEGKLTSIKNFTSLCTFFNVPTNGANYSAAFNTHDGLLYAGILSITVLLVFLLASAFFGSRRSLSFTLLWLCVIVFLTVLSVNSVRFRIGRDKAMMGWVSPVIDYVSAMDDIAADYPVILHSSATAKKIEHYQLGLRNFRMGNELTEAANATNCLIIAKKKYFLEEYYNNDYYIFDDFDYENSRDIVYVKGKELKKYLEKKGYSLTKYKGKLKKTPETDTE